MPYAAIPTGLYAIIDTTYIAIDSIGSVAAEILAGGCKTVQLRAKGLKADDKLRAARLLSTLCAKKHVTFIVNDRVDIALLSNANGVHIGQVDLPITDARELLKGKKIIGFSTHNRAEALEAQERGADYISVGPIFETQTKPDAERPKGLELLEEIVNAVEIPVVAIGGITEANMHDVLSTGVSSIAMISEILLAKDITRRTAGLIKKISLFKSKKR